VITVTIWHNVAVDRQGRHTAMMDGCRPGDSMVRVFAYQAAPAGRSAQEIAAEAFDIFNDHPRDAPGEKLAHLYYERRPDGADIPDSTVSAKEGGVGARAPEWDFVKRYVTATAEAGVKRHAVTHKHTDLKDRFYARVKAQDSIPAGETALRAQHAELRRKLDDMRAERDEYKHAADALARALNVLTIENDELRRKTSRTGPPMGPRPLISLRPIARLLHPAQLVAARS
jgi:hypothetical protein